jgi:hypothetical protein
MNIRVNFSHAVEHFVGLMWYFLKINKVKFFCSLVFFILILSACAFSADARDVKNKAYLEPSSEFSLDQEQASATQSVSNKEGLMQRSRNVKYV